MLTIVCATRVSAQDFHQQTLLGRCLPRLGEFEPLGLKLFSGNRSPLALAYNQAIDDARPDDVLMFVHDDVHLDDWMLTQRLREAFQLFDVVGVAGNRRRQQNQMTWYLQPFGDTVNGLPDWSQTVLDREFLSGAIAHGSGPEQNQLLSLIHI